MCFIFQRKYTIQIWKMNFPPYRWSRLPMKLNYFSSCLSWSQRITSRFRSCKTCFHFCVLNFHLYSYHHSLCKGQKKINDISLGIEGHSTAHHKPYWISGCISLHCRPLAMNGIPLTIDIDRIVQRSFHVMYLFLSPFQWELPSRKSLSCNAI